MVKAQRIRHKLARWLTLLMLLTITCFLQAQSSISPPPGIVILEIDGEVEYARPDWSKTQRLLPGTIINTSDLVFPIDATIMVLCPDGNLRHFTPPQLPPNTVIQCKFTDVIIGNPGMRRLRVLRGDNQDPNVPYVISPRATVVRTSTIEIVWNHIANVRKYIVTVKPKSGEAWVSGQLDPADVAQGDRASLVMPEVLTPNTAYTVDICVIYIDLSNRCTTSNSDWLEPNVEFYYVNDDEVNQAIQRIVDTVGETSATSLYARAMLLQQPTDSIIIGTEPAGYFSEALTLMEKILSDFPQSEIAQSPAFDYQMGELYRKVNLLRSASTTFSRMLPDPGDQGTSVTPGTELSAFAALGRALTTFTGDEVEFYDRALMDFAGYLQPDSYEQQFQEVCAAAGDMCAELEHFNTPS